jgi:hypothetical protein
MTAMLHVARSLRADAHSRQVIYDLLVRNSGPLELREDPEQGVQVAGLKAIAVKSAADIMVWYGSTHVTARPARHARSVQAWLTSDALHIAHGFLACLPAGATRGGQSAAQDRSH